MLIKQGSVGKYSISPQFSVKYQKEFRFQASAWPPVLVS